MSLLEKLNFDNVKQNPIIELKECKQPVLVYGGGSFARDILYYLTSNGVRVEGVFVDRGGFVLGDIVEEYSVKEVPIDHIDFPCVVVMGMANYLKGEDLYNDFIKKVYYLSYFPYGDNKPFTRDDVEKSLPSLEKTYSLLADDFSRQCMAAYLNARISNDASCVFLCYEGEQTYFSNSVFHVNPEENYADIGAYTGDTIKLFYDSCNERPGHIWAFEGDPELKKSIDNTINGCGITAQTDLYITGLWSEKKTLSFSKSEHNIEEGTIVDGGTGNTIEADTIDNLLRDRKDKVDILKINFANADEVLKGATQVVSTDKPKLSIVVGFFDHLIYDIPDIVKSIDSDYKIYFRYNSALPARLVMYAVAG